MNRFSGMFSQAGCDASRIYNEGWQAYHRSVECIDCPYGVGTEEYLDWISGWEDAAEEDQNG